jgi:hypothetical protein
MMSTSVAQCTIKRRKVLLTSVNSECSEFMHMDSSDNATTEVAEWSLLTLKPHVYIQGVPGETCQTSGGCSLC